MKEYQKEYKEKNKKKMAERQKEYYEENKKERLEKQREYQQTENGKKVRIISGWKRLGLICEDYDSLYSHYLNAENCDECDIRFGKYGDGSCTFKTCDHDHETGLFRNVLCSRCNIKRR